MSRPPRAFPTKVISKNPGVLTVPPASIKENVGPLGHVCILCRLPSKLVKSARAIVPLANVVGFFGDNPLIARVLLSQKHAWRHGPYFFELGPGTLRRPWSGCHLCRRRGCLP